MAPDAGAAVTGADEEVVHFHAAGTFGRPVLRDENGIADQRAAGFGDQRRDPGRASEEIPLELFGRDRCGIAVMGGKLGDHLAQFGEITWLGATDRHHRRTGRRNGLKGRGDGLQHSRLLMVLFRHQVP